MAVDGFVSSATQIGRRLFVGGLFPRVSLPTGGAVVVDASGAHVPAGFPRFEGAVNAIVADGLGGWVVVGGFTRVAGQPFSGFARVRPKRSVDPRYRLTTDGPVANRQRLVVGSGPGRDDLGAIEVAGPATSFTTAAPPGTYYVRARGVNSCGVGPFSNEARVEVR